MTDSETNYF